MAYRRLRVVLLAAAGSCVLLGIGVASFFLLTPLNETSGTSRKNRLTPAAKNSAVSEQRIAPGDFSGLLSKRLRRPLKDTTQSEISATPPPAPPEPPKVDAVLLGTAVETIPEKSMAWIRFVSENQSLPIHVGDTLKVEGSPKVISIQEGSVQLDFGGQTQTIKMPQRPR